jgi:hypothetical protein
MKEGCKLMADPSSGMPAGVTWKPLYKIGAVAALTAVIVFRRYFGVELMTFNGFGIFSVPATEPVRAIEWFALLEGEPFVGLALLGLFDLVNYALVGLIFLALYGALRSAPGGVVLLATVLGWAGIVVYFASNQAFGMLYLSRQYGLAPLEGQTEFLAAGEALLAVHRGTQGFLSLGLVLVAGLILSLVMLQNGTFSKWTAVAGILANSFGLGYFVALAFVPTIVWLPPTLSAPFRLLWYLLVARRLFQLGKG